MENNSLSNKSKAIALFKWTNRKYLSVSIAYWILLFLAYPLAEIFIMITSISADGKYNYYVDRMQTYGVLIPSTLFAAIAIGYSIVISLIAFSYMHNKRCVDLFGSITSPNSIGNVLSNEGDIQTGKQKNIVFFKVCLSYIFNIDTCYSYWFNRYDFIICT